MKNEPQQFKLRFPENLRKAIEKSAKDHRRSLTAELLLRLEQSLGQYPMDRAPQVVRVKGHAVDVHELPSPAYSDSEAERRLIDAFRRMPDEKKVALLALLSA